MEQPIKVNISAVINAPVEKVWKTWSTPADIMLWNSASPDWHTPAAENDLRTGGTFYSRMEARDGSFGFDFTGVYDEVIPHEYIAYTMPDGRQVQTKFVANGNATTIETVFDAETQNPVEMQRSGWQAILDNFKQYSEKK